MNLLLKFLKYVNCQIMTMMVTWKMLIFFSAKTVYLILLVIIICCNFFDLNFSICKNWCIGQMRTAVEPFSVLVLTSFSSVISQNFQSLSCSEITDSLSKIKPSLLQSLLTLWSFVWIIRSLSLKSSHLNGSSI